MLADFPLEVIEPTAIEIKGIRKNNAIIEKNIIAGIISFFLSLSFLEYSCARVISLLWNDFCSKKP